MAVTERVVVLMSPQDKADLEQKASKMGVSVAELVRRSTAEYEPEEDLGQVRALLVALHESHAETLQALEKAEHELEETKRYFAGKRCTA